MDDDSFACVHCKAQVSESDDFCTNCGNLFSDDVFCAVHPQEGAVAVCIICREPFCSICIRESNGKFLCPRHAEYEVYEGMARVYGSSDAVNVEYAKSCLEQAGLHPLIFSRKVGPWSVGGPDYSLFRASGEYGGHIVNEFKLMVPGPEVLKAEEILHQVSFTD